MEKVSVRLLLIGKAGAGKDTVARYLAERYGFKKYAFADRLKEICRDLFPEAFRGPKPRALLQGVGESMRRVDPDVWVRCLLRRIESEDPPRAVVTDCRYRNELEACAAAGFVPVLVECPDEVRAARLIARGDRPLTPEEAAHPSENDAFEALGGRPGRRLDNSGTVERLREQVDRLMQELRVKPVLPAGPGEGRPSWQETFMEVARVMARRSTCLRRKVGAVLVKDNRMIATGYNGAPKGMAHCDRTGCPREAGNVPSGQRHELCRAVHAEENCVIQAAVFGVSTVGAELYVTCHPCSLCARMLINAGVARVYYESEYEDPFASQLFAEAGIEVARIGDREDEANR